MDVYLWWTLKKITSSGSCVTLFPSCRLLLAHSWTDAGTDQTITRPYFDSFEAPLQTALSETPVWAVCVSSLGTSFLHFLPEFNMEALNVRLRWLHSGLLTAQLGNQHRCPRQWCETPSTPPKLLFNTSPRLTLFSKTLRRLLLLLCPCFVSNTNSNLATCFVNKTWLFQEQWVFLPSLLPFSLIIWLSPNLMNLKTLSLFYCCTFGEPSSAWASPNA